MNDDEWKRMVRDARQNFPDLVDNYTDPALTDSNKRPKPKGPAYKAGYGFMTALGFVVAVGLLALAGSAIVLGIWAIWQTIL